MGSPTKVQLIKRKASEQWYINLPAQIAQAMEFAKAEVVHWCIEDKETLVLRRPDAPPRLLEKKTPPPSSTPSMGSGTDAETPSTIEEPGNGDDGSA